MSQPSSITAVGTDGPEAVESIGTGGSVNPPGRSAPHGAHLRLVGIVLGLTTAVTLMVLAFAAPALKAGPTDLPLAVSGPEPAASRLTSTLAAQSPGMFDVTHHDSAEQSATAIRDRQAIGGLVVDDTGVTVQVATGAGGPYASLLKEVGAGLAASGQQVGYSELAPTTDDDRAGTAVAVLGLPLIFGGMATAAALLLGYRGSVRSRLAAALTLAALGGLAAAAVLQFGFGAFDGSYWLTAAAVAAGITAISFAVLGLGLVFGTPGLATGAVLMLLVANPLSGLSTGPDWLPQPWGAIGQYLPVGAAGSAVRSAAYFEGHGSAGSWLVLAAWVLSGLTLALLGAMRGRERRAAA